MSGNVIVRRIAPNAWTPERVGELANKFLEDNNFDVGRAARAMARAAEEDEALYNQLMRGAVEERALVAVRYARAKAKRNVHWNTEAKALSPAERDKNVYASTAAAMDLSNSGGLLDTFQLPDGTFLREATRDQIMAAAEFYLEQARELNASARWMRLIAQKLAPGQKVSAAFDEARIQELQTIAVAEREDDE